MHFSTNKNLTLNPPPSYAKKVLLMDQAQQPQPTQPNQQTQQTAASYYNNHHKHTFQFSRTTLIGSMCVLLIALTFNILALYSQNTSTLQSHAAGNKTEQVLPQLPSGCIYQQVSGGMAVICPKATPTPLPPVPITIALPQLPPQCSWQTTGNGNKVSCVGNPVPIPTVAVTLPTQCSATDQNNVASCKDATNQNVTVPLPSLPGGCLYALLANKYYVVCSAN